MDGLDVYIDEYNLGEPIPESMLPGLSHALEMLFGKFAGGEERAKRDQPTAVQTPAVETAAPEDDAAEPKIAALLAMAALPEPQPVTAVSYRSAGALLVVGPMDAAIAWAEQLKANTYVSVSCTSAGGTPPLRREYPIHSGSAAEITGHIGNFELAWQQDNPIDLERCTRCNAYLRACPEQAIGVAYPDRHGPLPCPQGLCGRLRTGRRHRFRAYRAPLRRALRPGARPAGQAADPTASSSTGLPGAASGSARPSQRGLGPWPAGRRIRKAEVPRLPRAYLRVLAQRNPGLQSLHRRLLDRHHPQ